MIYRTVTFLMTFNVTPFFNAVLTRT